MGDETDIYRIPYLTDEDLVEDTPNVDKEQAERIDYLFSVNTGPEGPEGPPGPPRDSMYGDLQPADPDNGGSEIAYAEKDEDVWIYWTSEYWGKEQEVIGPVEIETNGRPVIVEFDSQGVDLPDNRMSDVTSTGEHTYQKDARERNIFTFTKPGWNFLYVHAEVYVDQVFVWGGGGGGGASVAGSGIARWGGGGAAAIREYASSHTLPPGTYPIYVGRGGKGGTEENPDGQPGQASSYLDGMDKDFNDWVPRQRVSEGGGGGKGAETLGGAPSRSGDGGSNRSYNGGMGTSSAGGGGAGGFGSGNSNALGAPGVSGEAMNVVEEGDDWPYNPGTSVPYERIARGGCGGDFDEADLSHLTDYYRYLPTRAGDGGNGGVADSSATGWVNGEDGAPGMVQIRTNNYYSPPWDDWYANESDECWMNIGLSIDGAQSERIGRIECMNTIGRVTLPANCKRRLELPAGKHELTVVAEVNAYEAYLLGADGKPVSMRVYYA